MEDQMEMFKDMLDFNPREAQLKGSQAPSSVFSHLGENQAVETFKIASRTVPAYKDFLQKNKVDPNKINTIKDFYTLPLTNKKNYLKAYPIEDLLINGSFVGKSAITSSSGSSGVPFYWPRMPIQDFGAAKGWDTYLVSTFDIDKMSTLHLNCSGMGVWTAGDYITILNKYLCYKYSNNSSVSPGIDLDNTMDILVNIAPQFGQTIIYSYPPFAKDIVDNIPPKLIKSLNLKLVVYGEPYTEKWRTYVVKIINGSTNNFHHVSSVLGSSEGGLIGTESKACTLIRTIANDKKRLCKKLFGEDRVPSLVQYNPTAKYIEIINNNIIMTSLGGLPLIRYDTHDYGNLLTKEEIESSYSDILGGNLIEDAKKLDVYITSMPYLYVFGRSDYTASIYGILIYPETIKDILSSKPFSKFFSGKFFMTTKEDDKANQFLDIILEAKRNIDSQAVAIPSIEKLFAEHMKIYSSEYSKLIASAGSRVYPKISVKNYGNDEYFSSKNKQKYLI